jgi:hypothetical protein
VSATGRSRATPIRELGDEDFGARYGCDRFTATVLANRFQYIVEHMCARLLTAAFSPILRDFYDFAATLTGPAEIEYPTPAMSNSIVLFTGVMTESVRHTVEEYGVERLEPGDVIVANDPYRGGTHVNDLLFVRPVFHDGRVAGFVSLKAHQLDMGGVVPGGFTLTKRNIYEDGVVLSPRALFRRGEPVRETWSLIFDNVRFGEILRPDMQTVCAELDRGEALLLETVERYGVTAVHGAMRYVCDAASERISDGLAIMPDGSWTGEALVDCDGVDDSEEYLIRAAVTKRGGRLEVDFSGTSRQARTCMNCTALDVKTTVGLAFKYLFDPRGRVTSGAARCIDLVIPEGTCVNALPPDGAVFAYWEQSQTIISAVLRALAQAVGPAAMAGDRGSADIHNANGLLPDGTPWLSVAQCGGEVGPFGVTDQATRHVPVEAVQVLDHALDLVRVMQRVPCHAELVPGMRVHWLELHRALEGLGRPAMVAACRQRHAESVPGAIEFWLQAHGLAKGIDGRGRLVRLIVQKTEIEPGGRIARGQLDDPAERRLGLGVVLQRGQQVSECVGGTRKAGIGVQGVAVRGQCRLRLLDGTQQARAQVMAPGIEVHQRRFRLCKALPAIVECGARPGKGRARTA